MILRSILLTSIMASAGSIAPPQTTNWNAGLADNLSNVTVSVLSKLGYDCQTVNVGGILCKKCQVEDNKQKCEAFLCDAVTKNAVKSQRKFLSYHLATESQDRAEL